MFDKEPGIVLYVLKEEHGVVTSFPRGADGVGTCATTWCAGGLPSLEA